MNAFSALSPAVSACTNVLEQSNETIDTCITNTELAECFQNARRSNTHTQPLPSDPKEIKKLLARLDTFNSSLLNTFLFGYMDPLENIPEAKLNDIRTLLVNSDPEWTNRCQALAFDILRKELQARSGNIIPRSNHDDPIALAQLRRSLPAIKHVPKATVNNCQFKFIGGFSSDTEENARQYSATVRIQNSGSHSFSVEVCQTQTIIDGTLAEKSFMKNLMEKQTLGRGEGVEVALTIGQAPRAGFSEMQQLIVLSFDSIMKYFIVYTIVNPRQRIFRQRLPNCLPLTVHHSPLGVYSAPIILQILKHQFVRQHGLTSAAAVHLLAGKAVNYRPHNQEVMREALRVVELFEEQFSLSTALEAFWNAQPAASKKAAFVAPRSRPPPSSAQPPGYLPAGDTPTEGSTTGDLALFPNAYTTIPDVITRAPPAVIFGVILIWLAQMEIEVFDESFFNCDPATYIETTPPYIRGILMYVVDLCCALLLNQDTNGSSVRSLALTFASVLVRHKQFFRHGVDTSEAFGATGTDAAGFPPGTFTTEVGLHQSAVSALTFWITVFMNKYLKRM